MNIETGKIYNLDELNEFNKSISKNLVEIDSIEMTKNKKEKKLLVYMII